MIHNLNWESLETCRIKASLHMFYKMFNHLASIPFDHYTKLSFVTATRLSHYLKLTPISSKKNALKLSFMARTIPIWNHLPEDLINCS